ncbi:MAG: KpsF/GutQ family sugar-phosphate isomerase, partial [Thermoguttaceae bacterium]|nr:KpsF/GutQ family sugar-phosphate isomerase [Thermoguttaceae bacterium]
EARAVLELAQRLDKAFCLAADLIFHCQGSVIVTGMGKAGLVGQKIVATLASTGTPSHWLHPAEAVHGDLGRIRPCDVVLVLSQSGETEEIVRLLPSLRALGPPIIAVTGGLSSTLARAANVVIDLGSLEEACPLGLAPTTSSTAMLAVGDALALVVSRMRGFHREDFARFHPAGSLGRKLSKVDDHLRPLSQCRVAREDMTVREVFVRLSTPGRRTGAIMLVDPSGRLAGIFTDSDLARLFERRRDRELDGPIREVMTSNPVTIPLGSPMTEAVAILAQRKISELPVVDEEGRPAGLIDVTDVVGLLPQELPDGETLPAAGPITPSEHLKPSYRVFREPEEGDVA